MGCGEMTLRIHHHLLVKDPAQAVNRIYSHAQSLGQCRLWLDQHYPGIERIAVSSNAEAARRASQETDSAAIAGDVAADLSKNNQEKIQNAKTKSSKDNKSNSRNRNK